MAVREDFPEELAYNLTKIMLEKREDLAQGPQGGAQHQGREPEVGQRRHSLAPGALKYFAEKGIKVD